MPLSERRKNRRRFKRQFKRQLERAKKNELISEEDYQKGLLACENEALMDKAVDEIEGDGDGWGAIDWPKLVEWFKEHWQEILKLVLSLVVMFI